MVDKLVNANLAAKAIALASFALVVAVVLAVPAANVYNYFYPPAGFIGPPPPIPGIFFLFGFVFSLPLSFGFFAAFLFSWQRKILTVAFIILPSLLLNPVVVLAFLSPQTADWQLVIESISLGAPFALFGFLPGLSLRYAFSKLKR